MLDELPPEPSYMAVQKLVDEFKVSGADPVSYTHLDVYKRQGMDRLRSVCRILALRSFWLSTKAV